MSEEQAQQKIAVMTQNESLIAICSEEAKRIGAMCESFSEFISFEDPRLVEYAVVIIDAEHPESSGIEWFEKLRAFPVFKNLPVIVASAFLSDAQADALRKAYPDSSQVPLRVPVSQESLRSLLAYYLKREGDIAMALPKAASAEEDSDEIRPPVDQNENASLKELYERQLMKDNQEEVSTQNADVINLKNRKKQSPIYQEKDVDALHRYIELREKDLSRLSDALHRTQERLDQNYANLDYVRLEQSQLKKEKEDVDVKHLSLKDEFERFKMSSQREKQALIEDYQIKLAHKEVLEGNYKDVKHRLQSFKNRIREEVKLVRKHERDLEQKLQILKSDTDLLIRSKDERILILSKKVEELYEQVGRLNDRIRRSEETVVGQFDRQSRVLKALRLASSLLDEPEEGEELEEKAS
jgi:CheY-like chemotaxis protein